MTFDPSRIFFGVHSFTAYRRSNGVPYGQEIRVLKGSSLALSGEVIELFGGSSKYSWAVEDGQIAGEMSLKPAEFPNWLWEVFLGKAPTANTAEASGNASAVANKSGTSVVNATTGITSVLTVGTAADLKFGKYVVQAASATTVNVFLLSDVDIARGTNGTIDSTHKILGPLTITSGAPTALTGFGLSFNGGSGAIALVTGDTATFEVRPVNSKSMTVSVGSVADQLFPEFGALVLAQKRGNQEMMEVDCVRCKGVGFPLNFEMNAFAEAEIKVKVMYDETLDRVFDIRHVSPT